jgi:hypothetical protein
VVVANPVDIDKPGEYTLTYNATDAAGNKAVEVTRKVTVVDTTGPVITLLGDAEVIHEGATDYTDAGATVTDNFDAEVEVVVVNPVDIAKPGEYTLTYNATDATGNKAVEVTRKVTVVDTTIPVITLKGEGEVTIEYGSEYTDAGATATDTVDGDLSEKIEFINPLNPNRTGTYTLTYNLTDAAGNDAEEVVRKVTVEDTTAPVLTLLGEPQVIINVLEPFEDPGFTSIDLRDGDISEEVVVDTSALNILELGQYEVLYTSTDKAGNQATAKRTVFVNDLTPPSITLLGDASVSIAFKAIYVDAGATALDNIDGDLSHKVVVDNPVSSVVPGEFTITYTVTDNAGNSASTTRSVTVGLTQGSGIRGLAHWQGL